MKECITMRGMETYKECLPDSQVMSGSGLVSLLYLIFDHYPYLKASVSRPAQLAEPALILKPNPQPQRKSKMFPYSPPMTPDFPSLTPKPTPPHLTSHGLFSPRPLRPRKTLIHLPPLHRHSRIAPHLPNRNVQYSPINLIDLAPLGPHRGSNGTPNNQRHNRQRNAGCLESH